LGMATVKVGLFRDDFNVRGIQYKPIQFTIKAYLYPEVLP